MGFLSCLVLGLLFGGWGVGGLQMEFKGQHES